MSLKMCLFLQLFFLAIPLRFITLILGVIVNARIGLYSIGLNPLTLFCMIQGIVLQSQ